MFYQTNDKGISVGLSPYQAKGFGDVEVAPPDAPDGCVARWVSGVPRGDLSFGENETGHWSIVEDHQYTVLYTPDGKYEINTEYDGEIYDGLGEIPNWLSTEAPELPPAPPYIPQQVTNAQGAAALIQAGLWQSILDYVDGIQDATEKTLAEVALHRTTHWQRTSPFLNSAATELGLSDEDLDNLFIQAAGIEL